MPKYGQYCPVAKSLEILGDHWTLLIVRELLTGARHFNELERGLPRISRALLASRLRHLQHAGIIDKYLGGVGRNTTEYQLTQSGRELFAVVGALRTWGEAWAFGDPEPAELDPVLLMWRLRSQVDRDQLPDHRVVVQFDFYGPTFTSVEKGSFWLILTKADVTLCVTDPGFEVDLIVTADLATFYRLWGGRITYTAALDRYRVSVDGAPSFARAFPRWFGWSAITLSPARSPSIVSL
jgi:DNA-binding HxlR family transcriptional regulator